MPKDKKDTNNNNSGIFKVLEFITEVFGWLQIVVSPLLIGLGIGAIIYFPNPSITRLIIGIIVACIGLVIGVYWATKKWKGKGTVFFSLEFRRRLNWISGMKKVVRQSQCLTK